MANKLYAKFSNIDKEFPIVDGATFTDTLNETLSSGSIIISKVSVEDRLNIHPFDFVCVYNKSTAFVDKYEQHFLVDDFIEREVNISNRYFQYTIKLMSLTKLLEKIQLPNRTISHSLVSGRKTIHEYLEHFIEFYSPRIKYYNSNNTWSYRPLIRFNESLLGDKFKVECRDFSFSNPTLRQVLTTLMLQVHCLPVIVQNGAGNNTQLCLSYLDLDKFNGVIDIENDDSINYIIRSNASDSYINNIVNLGSNILDENNIVKVKNVGFRDSEKALIKQKENLKLTTQFPIYNVKKLVMKMFVKANSGVISATNNLNGYVDVFSLSDLVIGTSTLSFRINTPLFDASDTYTLLSGARINLIKSFQENGNTYYKVVKSITTTKNYVSVIDGSSCYIRVSDLSFSSSESFDNISVIGQIKAVYTPTTSSTITSTVSYVDATFLTAQDGIRRAKINLNNFVFLTKLDISKLCVEKSKRQLLDTDYVKMQNCSSVSELSKYYYGTFEYSIGGNEIYGFSDTYSLAVLWWNVEYTYIENIINVFLKNEINNTLTRNLYEDSDFTNNYLGGFAVGFLSDSGITIVNYLNDNWGYLYSSVIFDIEYQPLNTIRSNFVKENDNDRHFFPLQQLDNSSSGIITFDDFSTSEKEKVNRLGNDIISIKQRTKYGNSIYQLGTIIEGDYIIYQRVIKRNHYFYEVNYYASKSAILKTYITSIETKYRAYEYIDYNSAVERKENALFYVIIDSKVSFDGTDKLAVLDNGGNLKTYPYFASAICKIKYSNYLLKYGFESETNIDTYYALQLSTLCYDSGFILSLRESDNQSFGNYLISIINSNNKEQYGGLGGVPQGWYIKSDSWNTKSFIGVFSKEYFADINAMTISESTNKLNDVVSYPRLDFEVVNDFLANNLVFYITNYSIENTSLMYMNYFLDRGEYLNQSIQFEIVNYSNDFKISKFFNIYSQLNYDRDINNYLLCVIKSEEFSVSNAPTSYSDSDIIIDSSNSSYETLIYVPNYVIGSYIRVFWNSSLIPSDTKNLKIAVKIDNVFYDLCVFNKENSKINIGNAYYDISVSDTKTLSVATYDSKNQLDFSKYEVESDRNVKQKGV